MRPAPWSVLPLLAACALPPVAPRTPGAQEPQGHIDQREPQLPGTGPRPFRAPVLAASAGVGLANVAVRIPGLGIDDRADARTLRLAVETATVALHLDATDSETELFPEQRISDGSMPAPADAALLALDAFPHVRFDTVDAPRVRLPLRLGVFADWRHLDHELAAVDRQWVSLGPRVVVEPTWRAVRGERFAVDVIASLGGEVGVASFREKWPTGDDRDTVARWGGEAGLSLRALFDRAHVELGYRVHHAVFGPTDGDLFGEQHRTEQQVQQLVLGFGYTF